LPLRVTATGNAMDYDYAYDANGNVERIYDYVTGTPTPRHRWMGYDGLDRLTSVASAVFGGSDHTHRFTYDALDNLESWKHAGVKDYADYVYDQQNRLTNIRNTAGATVVGLIYDPQGNLQNKNGQGYEFDYGNRLRSVAGKESYRYDGLGRRVQTTSTDGKTTVWQYSQSGQMLFWSDWGGPGGQGQQTHENVYLAGSLIAIIDHAWPSNAVLATKYQHTDALGSPVAVTNAAGQVIERVDYEPWGAVIGNPTRSGMGYTGHVMDGSTGLTYMQQRYYDPSLGRFLSTDPVQPDPMDGGNFNRYWYAANNPYFYRDPDGRYVCKASKAECVDFNRAMQSARTALSSSKLSTAEREALQRAVDFYGEEGDEKVTIEFGDIKDGDANISVQQDGTATVKFDPKKLARSNESNSMHSLAKAIVHEGDHGANDRDRGEPVGTREERTQAEVSAYTAQAYYQKATGFVDIGMNGWAAWSGINHDVIKKQADLSVMAACGSSTEGSCK
jgi:RHS repeat-associated protein